MRQSRTTVTALFILAAVVAAGTGLLTAYEPSFPPRLEPRGLARGSATALLVVDTRPTSRLGTDGGSLRRLEAKSRLIQRMMSTNGVVERTAALLEADSRDIAAQSGVNRPEQRSLVGTGAASRDVRAYVLARRATPYAIRFDMRFRTPLIRATAQAPTVAGARALIQASVVAMNAELRDRRRDLPVEKRRRTREVVILQEAPIVSQSLGFGNNLTVAAATGVLTFTGLVILILLLRRRVPKRDRRRSDDGTSHAEPQMTTT